MNREDWERIQVVLECVKEAREVPIETLKANRQMLIQWGHERGLGEFMARIVDYVINGKGASEA